MIILRAYQADLVEQARAEVAKGRKRVLAVLPTGGGKTFVLADIASRATEKGGKVLCLMHRRHLVDQMTARFQDYGLEPGIIMAGSDTGLSRPIQIATMQTYSRRIQLDEGGLYPFFIDADVVLVDEAHRSLSKTYQHILELYREKVVIGVTATPCLSSGVGMGKYYQALVAPVGVCQLIDQGHLVPARYFAPRKPDLAGIRTVAGDFEKKALGERMNTPTLVGDVFQNWAKIAGGLQTIIFAVNVKHSKALCREFTGRGVPCAHLDAHSSDEQRQEILSDLFQKRLQVVFNVGLYTEGFDYPAAECIVLARPTKSRGLFLQMAGRGLRTYPGKKEVIIIDHGGNIDRLGFVDDPIIWTLDGKKPAWGSTPQRKKEKTPITCDMCSAVFIGRRCPDCGFEIQNWGKRIEAIDADLQEIRPGKQNAPTWAEKARWWGMFEYHRRMKGYAEGWTAHRYREKFGTWPEGVDSYGPTQPDSAFYNWLKHLAIKWRKQREKQEQEVEAL